MNTFTIEHFFFFNIKKLLEHGAQNILEVEINLSKRIEDKRSHSNKLNGRRTNQWKNMILSPICQLTKPRNCSIATTKIALHKNDPFIILCHFTNHTIYMNLEYSECRNANDCILVFFFLFFDFHITLIPVNVT